MKYMGSKNRIAKYILPIILKDRKEGQWYVEPFVGGANMIDKVDGNRIGSDCNKYLIELLSAISNGETFSKITIEEYRKIKNNPDKYYPQEVGYAGICASYSGKWFGGYAGIVNTREGVRDYQSEAINNIENQREGLKGIDFRYYNYNNLKFPKNSIIYCDPPYIGTTKYKDSFNHEEFYNWCREKRKQGHTIFISEYTMPEDFNCVWEMEIKSSLSSNGKSGGSKKSIEKLFTI